MKKKLLMPSSAASISNIRRRLPLELWLRMLSSRPWRTGVRAKVSLFIMVQKASSRADSRMNFIEQFCFCPICSRQAKAGYLMDPVELIRLLKGDPHSPHTTFLEKGYLLWYLPAPRVTVFSFACCRSIFPAV